MKLDQLAYFLETARVQHVGRAAKVLRLSPSAISHAISALEEELGTELFVKQGKHIVLTDAGRKLVIRASEVLTSVESMRQEMSSGVAAMAGHWRLGATHTLAAEVLVPACVEVQRLHASVELEVFSQRSAEIIAAVAARELDFGICFSPYPHPALHREVIFESKLVFAARKGHPILKVPMNQRAALLSKYPASAPKAFQGVENCEVHPVLRRLKIKPNVIFIYDSYDVACAMLGASDSWTLIPESTLLGNADRAKLAVVLDPAPYAPVEVCAIWPIDHILHPVLQLLLQQLKQEEKTK